MRKSNHEMQKRLGLVHAQHSSDTESEVTMAARAFLTDLDLSVPQVYDGETAETISRLLVDDIFVDDLVDALTSPLGSEDRTESFIRLFMQDSEFLTQHEKRQLSQDKIGKAKRATIEDIMTALAKKRFGVETKIVDTDVPEPDISEVVVEGSSESVSTDEYLARLREQYMSPEAEPDKELIAKLILFELSQHGKYLDAGNYGVVVAFDTDTFIPETLGLLKSVDPDFFGTVEKVSKILKVGDRKELDHEMAMQMKARQVLEALHAAGHEIARIPNLSRKVVIDLPKEQHDDIVHPFLREIGKFGGKKDMEQADVYGFVMDRVEGKNLSDVMARMVMTKIVEDAIHNERVKSNDSTLGSKDRGRRTIKVRGENFVFDRTSIEAGLRGVYFDEISDVEAFIDSLALEEIRIFLEEKVYFKPKNPLDLQEVARIEGLNAEIAYSILRERIGIGTEVRMSRSVQKQLRSAVDALHKAGIYHRDLHPKNIMLDSNGQVWIIDFGMSIEVSEGDADPYQTLQGSRIKDENIQELPFLFIE